MQHLGSRTGRALGTALALALTLGLAPGGLAPWAATPVWAQIDENDPDWTPTADQIAEIQTRLTALGFFRGNATGNFGPKTRRSIQAYQEANGLEPADGRLSRAVFAHIMSSVIPDSGETAADTTGTDEAPADAEPPATPEPAPQNAEAAATDTPAPPAAPPAAETAEVTDAPPLTDATPPEAMDAPPPAETADVTPSTDPPLGPPAAPPAGSGTPVDCSALAGAVWRFTDSTGAELELTLADEGAILGPPYPDHWRWRSTADGLEIDYNSGLGLRVSRVGRQTTRDRLEGDARDSRGRTWTWSADRMRWRSEEHALRCPAPGTS